MHVGENTALIEEFTSGYRELTSSISSIHASNLKSILDLTDRISAVEQKLYRTKDLSNALRHLHTAVDTGRTGLSDQLATPRDTADPFAVIPSPTSNLMADCDGFLTPFMSSLFEELPTQMENTVGQLDQLSKQLDIAKSLRVLTGFSSSQLDQALRRLESSPAAFVNGNDQPNIPVGIHNRPLSAEEDEHAARLVSNVMEILDRLASIQRYRTDHLQRVRGTRALLEIRIAQQTLLRDHTRGIHASLKHQESLLSAAPSGIGDDANEHDALMVFEDARFGRWKDEQLVKSSSSILEWERSEEETDQYLQLLQRELDAVVLIEKALEDSQQNLARVKDSLSRVVRKTVSWRAKLASSVRRVPSDVWKMVFGEVVDNEILGMRASMAVQHMVCRSALRFGAVCHWWRIWSRTTPSLWRYLSSPRHVYPRHDLSEALFQLQHSLAPLNNLELTIQASYDPFSNQIIPTPLPFPLKRLNVIDSPHALPASWPSPEVLWCQTGFIPLSVLQHTKGLIISGQCPSIDSQTNVTRLVVAIAGLEFSSHWFQNFPRLMHLELLAHSGHLLASNLPPGPPITLRHLRSLVIAAAHIAPLVRYAQGAQILPNAKHLTLVDLSPGSMGVAASLSSLFSKLTCLKVNTTSEIHPADILRVRNAFNDLETIELPGSTIAPTFILYSTTHTPPLAIENLVICDYKGDGSQIKDAFDVYTSSQATEDEREVVRRMKLDFINCVNVTYPMRAAIQEVLAKI